MKFCKKCNSLTKRRANGDCVPCAIARGAVYRAENAVKIAASRATYAAANKEKIKERNLAWRMANLDKEKASNAAWHAANREKTRARRKAWRAANKDKVSAQNSSWWSANKEERRAYLVRWRLANPELTRIHKQNRRSREIDGGKLSKDIVSKLLKLQRGKCACCGKPLGDDYHLDHRMPLALGGTNEDWNMQLLTATCNLQKHKKHPIEFMQQRGFLL